MKNNGVEIREATPDDLRFFHGDNIPWEIRAWVAVYRGVPAAITGIRIIGDEMVVYSEHRADIDAPKMLRFRTARALMDRVIATGLPVTTVALATGERQYAEKSGRFLELMGFKYSHWDTGRADDPRGCAFFKLSE